MENKVKTVFQALIILILFFTYPFIFDALALVFGIKNELLPLIFGDVIFLILMILCYKKDLILDWKNFKFNFPLLFGSFLFILFFGIIINVLISIFTPDKVIANNYQALADLNIVYIIFKTLIFSIVAEELVFRKALGKAINNKIVFVLFSAIIYTIGNVIYWDLTLITTWLNAISYFVIYLILSVVYVKYNYNIYSAMLIKFLYNLISLSIIFLA